MAHKVGELIGQTRFVAIPFAGGMTEIPHLKASSVLVNDRHVHVMNLARIVADPIKGPRLIRRLRRTPFHIRQLRESQEFCIDHESRSTDSMFVKPVIQIDEEDWAYHYFITSWMARAGSSGTDREFKAGFSYRNDGNGGGSAKRFYSMASGLPLWRRIFRRCEFLCKDGFEFIADLPDNDKADRAIYSDSPFPVVGDKYKHTFSTADHTKLRDHLSRFRFSKVVIRYYSHPLIEELYKGNGWTINRFEGRTQTNDAAPEVLITRNL